MELQRISPEEAKALVDGEGYALVDVRSISEFSEGHPEGAYNIPVLHKAPHGMIPNREFFAVVQKTFPDPKTKLIFTDDMGARAVRAAESLLDLGYEDVQAIRGGFLGEKDDDGNIAAKGWKDLGLPTGAGEPEVRGYRFLAPPPGAPAGPACGPGGALDAADPKPNRFAHPTRKVDCVKYGKELPALKRKPLGGELGDKIFAQVSADAWDLWVEHSKMIINEYRMNPADPRSQEMLIQQCETFFFGEGAQLPEGFVPEAMGK